MDKTVITELKNRALVVRNATIEGENTANRVGQLLYDIIDYDEDQSDAITDLETGGGGGGTVEDSFSTTSTNALQNKLLSNVIALKNYSSSSNTGLGIKLFVPSIDGTTLGSSSFSNTNTIYIIKYDFTLSNNIVMPANCILRFDGGSLTGRTIRGNDTIIEAGLTQIFNGVTLSGTWKAREVYVDWWGAAGDGFTDDTNAIQAAVTFASNNGINDVFLGNNKEYSISDTINLKKDVCLNGGGSTLFFDSTVTSSCLVEITNGTNGDKTNICLKNIYINGYYGGYNGYIVYESTIQTTVPPDITNAVMCRAVSGTTPAIAGVIGINIACFGVGIENVHISNCYYGIGSVNMNSTWCPSLTKVYIRHCYYGVYFYRQNGYDSGERANIIDSIIGNCVIAAYSYQWQLYFNSTSFDYNMYIVKDDLNAPGVSYASHGFLTFSDCYMERVGMLSTPWFCRVAHVNLINTVINHENYTVDNVETTTYLFDACASAYMVNCMINSPKMYIAKEYTTIDWSKGWKNTGLYMQNCINIFMKDPIIPKLSYNLIENGDFSDTTNINAFSVPTGSTNILSIATMPASGSTPAYNYLKIDPGTGQFSEHKYQYLITLYPRKDFYLFFDTAKEVEGDDTTKIIYTKVYQYDINGRELRQDLYTTKANYTYSGFISNEKIVVYPNVAKVVVERNFVANSAGDALDPNLNHDKGIYAFEL